MQIATAPLWKQQEMLIDARYGGRHNTRSLQIAAAYGGFMMNNVLSPPMRGPLVRWLAPQRGANARHVGGDRLTLSPKAKFGIEMCVRCVRLHALSC